LTDRVVVGSIRGTITISSSGGFVNILVALHNIGRWVIIILAIIALFRAYRGWLGKREWLDVDRKAGIFFTVGLDVQLLLGVILWIFGNWGIKAFDLAESVEGGGRLSVLYFAVDHAVSMLVAVVLAHIGTATAKKIKDSVNKHKRVAIFFTLSILLILTAIPWTQRPLFPGL
jgi:hypothetical protein